VTADSQQPTYSPPEPGGAPTPSLPLPGHPWGKYLIEKSLGRGGQAEVFQAFDQFGALGHVALKVPSMPVPREQTQQWIAEEVGPLGKLEHPNIVRVVDAGSVGTFPYVATELIDGLTLNEYVRATPPSTQQILQWMTELVEALDAAHSRGVIHRDLKPLNVIVTPDGRPRLIDFGLASFVTAYQPQARRDPSGTYPFMAPEQAQGRPEADQRVDVFAAGALLKYLLVGEGPYHGAESALKAARAGQVKLIAEAGGPGLRRALCRIANRALAPDPADRPQNMKELLRDLRGLHRRRHVLPAAALVVGLLLLAALAAVAVGKLWGGAAASRGTLQVYVRRSDAKQRLPLTDLEAVPVRPDDRIHIHAKFSEPLRAYVMAVCAPGGVRQLYPADGQSPEPAEELDIPAPGDEWMAPPAASGTVTILLLARAEPLEAGGEAVRKLVSLASPPVIAGRGLLLLDDRGLHRLPRTKVKPGEGQRALVDAGFLDMLTQRETQHWQVVRAVAFPVRSAEGTREVDRPALRERLNRLRPSPAEPGQTPRTDRPRQPE